MISGYQIWVSISSKSKCYEKYEEIRNGISMYNLQDDLINQSKCWKHWADQSRAIWYSNNHWRIGYTKSIGTDDCVMKAKGSSDQLPTEFTFKWCYWDQDSKDWIKGGNDISLNFQIPQLIEK